MRQLRTSKTENGAPYMVMEYLDGATSRLLARGGPLPIAEAVDCRAPGLRSARRGARARHRAPRPQAGEPVPVAARADGTPSIKVLDFGISKWRSAAGLPAPRRSMTKTHALLGSPLYMSPEQMRARRKDVDARSDIWALGVILYELLSGKLPFNGTSLPEVCMAYETPPAAFHLGPETAGLGASHSQYREKRYGNVAELAASDPRGFRLRPHFLSPRASRRRSLRRHLRSLQRPARAPAPGAHLRRKQGTRRRLVIGWCAGYLPLFIRWREGLRRHCRRVMPLQLSVGPAVKLLRMLPAAQNSPHRAVAAISRAARNRLDIASGRASRSRKTT